jgi:hypothetical protein
MAAWCATHSGEDIRELRSWTTSEIQGDAKYVRWPGLMGCASVRTTHYLIGANKLGALRDVGLFFLCKVAQKCGTPERKVVGP